MTEPPQLGGEGWQLDDYRKFVDKNVTSLRKWYRKRSRRNRWFFRGSGVLVIGLSVVLPLLAGFDFDYKDWTLGGIGVAIAALTALRNFYRWDELWGLLRQSDFALTELLAQWELALAKAKSPEDVHKLTEKLLQDAADVRRAESTGYFATLRFPESKQ